jgi:hypothetical protein
MVGDVKFIPFCVPLSSIDDIGIVGIITIRSSSAVIWFGWGAIEAVGEEDVVNNDDDGCYSVGNGRPPMGSLALSMPPYNSRQNEVSSTQLLGGMSEDDMILGHQISARLAKRIGWPIFVSCSFGGWAGDSGGSIKGGAAVSSAGYDDSTQRHAVSLAEREISRILMLEKLARTP